MQLQIRRPALDLSVDLPRWWYGGDAFATHYLDALSSVFPDGEAFFVRSVLRYRASLDDPELARAVQGFAGQEAQHSHHHDRHLALLHGHGYTALGRMNRLMDRAMRLQNRWLPKVSLAGTASAEHLTALLARRILENGAEFTRPMDPRMAELWRWHALEEAEHKAVAYDVLLRVAPSWPLRVLMLVFTSAGLFFEILARTAYMLWKDGVLLERETWRSARRFLFARGGLLRGHGPAYLAWFRRDFHPTQNDDGALIETWRERLARPLSP